MSLRKAGSRFLKSWKTNRAGDFYSCVRWPLSTYRYLSLFPVSLQSNNGVNSFEFKWKSPYMIFLTIPILVLHAVMAGFYIYDNFQTGIIYPGISLTLNYVFGLMASLYMLRIAKNFKVMIKKIVSIEGKLPAIKNNSNGILFLPVIIIFGYLGSFVQCILNTMYLYHMAVMCTPLNDDTVLKTYFDHVFPSIFGYIDFTYVGALIFQMVKFQNLFLTTLNNIFVISCSVYLENRFNNLNHIIETEQKKYKGVVYMDWRKIQDHYVMLKKLAQVIDKKINPIVFIAFFIDLYNLCMQFYYVVNKKSYYAFINVNTDCVTIHSGDLLAKFYKPYTALFVLCKIVTVSLLCARLHTASREPLIGLHTIPRAVYNYDTHRFMEQVYHSNVALSGFEFFYITKEMILTVLRILVTYELVLLQLK